VVCTAEGWEVVAFLGPMPLMQYAWSTAAFTLRMWSRVMMKQWVLHITCETQLVLQGGLLNQLPGCSFNQLQLHAPFGGSSSRFLIWIISRAVDEQNFTLVVVLVSVTLAIFASLSKLSVA